MGNFRVLDFREIGKEIEAALTRAASSLASPAGMEGWMPMDSAPKDGTKFDVWYLAHGHDAAYRLTDVYWSDVQDDFCTDGQFGPEEPAPLMLYPRPSHWRHRPAAPRGEAE